LAGRFVSDDGGFANLSSLTEDFAQVVFRSVERQVADLEFVIGHFILSFVSGSSHWLTPVVGLKSPLETAARTAEETQLATYHTPLKGSSKTALDPYIPELARAIGITEINKFDE
jgi:hypothetical protein